jgi:hypothetical protein
MHPNAARLHGAALRAARRGWYVFPLWPNSKTPALHGYRDCPGAADCAEGHLGWEQRATRDEQRIAAYWSRLPGANVGVACGPSALVVLDLDTPGGEHAETTRVAHGADTLARLAHEAQGEGYELPDHTFAVATSSGGIHLYYQAPVGVTLRNTSGVAGALLDSRGAGGYVVAAGSVRPNGAYRVVNDAPVAELPDWLIPHLTPPVHEAPQPARRAGNAAPATDKRVTAYLATVTQKVIDAPQGSRHDVLLRAAASFGRLVGGGDLSEQLARDTLLQAAATLDDFSTTEAARCIEDGVRYGIARPRRLGG